MYDLIIAGGGPAGLTAGIYAKRAGLNAVLFEGMFPGGQIVNTHLLENYPAFPDGVNGADFGMLLAKHAENAGLEIRYEEIREFGFEGKAKIVRTDLGTYEARSIILAMGASPSKLGVSREEELTGSGISYCAVCDGAFYKNRSVAVVGGGDTALSDAVYLSNLADKVYLIHRRDAFRGSDVLVKKAEEKTNIELVLDSTVESIEGINRLEKLSVRNKKTDLKRDIEVQGLFVAVGVVPKTELLKGKLSLTDRGYILTDECMRTSAEGVFAAGDIRNTPLRQVVTAAADGAIAATYVNEMLLRQ